LTDLLRLTHRSEENKTADPAGQRRKGSSSLRGTAPPVAKLHASVSKGEKGKKKKRGPEIDVISSLKEGGKKRKKKGKEVVEFFPGPVWPVLP